MRSADRTGALLLDTHCWIWMQAGSERELSAHGRTAIENSAHAGTLLVSVISVWELGMLEAKGRIRLKKPLHDWVKEALATPGMTLAAFSPEIAMDSTRLPGDFHGDPADRIIAATARHLGARLLTKDKQLLRYGSQRHLNVLAA